MSDKPKWVDLFGIDPDFTSMSDEAHDLLAAEVEPWLQECGSCDAALPMACTCPPGDYRVILLKVWRAYEKAASDA